MWIGDRIVRSFLSEAYLHPNNGLDTVRPSGVNEADYAIQSVVIGERERGHAQISGSAEETIGRGCTIQKAEIAVNVKLDHQS